jgi:hypothetical protein
MEQKCREMSSEEKSNAMFQSWLSPQNVQFTNPEAETFYKERVTRIKDAVQLKKLPDRIPIFPFVGFFPAFYCGCTPEDVMYNYKKLYKAWTKYVLDFEPDAHTGSFIPGPGRLFEILDYKLYAWPGHGVSSKNSYQCLEDEYVKADEYDALIQDPSNYIRNIYTSRIFGALDSFKALPPLTGILELPFTAFDLAQYGLPKVQTAFKSFLKASREALRWKIYIDEWDKEMASYGFPNIFGGFTKAPYDALGDTLRGSKGIIFDIYRQPEKLLKALDAITPLMINLGLSGAKIKRNPIIFLPLHKGDDSFLSDEQFKVFYWPSLRKVLLGLIDEGCVPFCFVEGCYNSRLEIIKDLPAGKTIWIFDQTDMVKAKEILGKTACIGGNMPSTLLCFGTIQDIKDYTKNLIDIAGKDGGFIMVNGAILDEAKPENLKTMIDFTKQYGIY